MKFTSAGLVEQVVWNMRLADLPRGTNRAHIDRLFNGNPPWTSAEQEQNRVATNVNWLEAPKLAADARRSYSNAFLKPGQFFTITLDTGPVHKRAAWGRILTREMNKVMKRSLRYLELLKSQFALTVLHGIGPAFWVDRDRWCPKPMSIQDVLIPGNTLLTMENLQYFAIFRQYTPMELYQFTHGPKVDPAWNMPVVNGALEWVDEQTQAQLNYTDLYAPQNVEDRWKQDLGFYGTDSVPTVDAWDFYYWCDEGKKAGWRRCMIMDTPASYDVANPTGKRSMPSKTGTGQDHGQYLYDARDRVYAENWQEILHFQFGDASAVAPFRYHSVRSLGWLLYSVCHLQNRLRCRLNDAIFESLLQYFRSSNPDDHERITKVDLQNFGVVPDGISFVLPNERWQVNEALVTAGLGQNRDMMMQAAAQYREGRDVTGQDREKTATQIMAEVNAANALVGSMLLQAYNYQTFQYRECGRRFCQKNSIDPDVRSFRVNVLKAGVPEKMLDCSMWNIEPERVVGAGNKMLEIAMTDKLMAARQLFDPESQREILNRYTLANSDDPDLTNRLVPMEEARVSDSVHDALLAFGTMMQGVPVPPRKGQNAREVIETLLRGMVAIVARIQKQGLPTEQEYMGLGVVAQSITHWLQLLGQDKAEKERVRQYGDALGKLVNIIRGYGQRLAEQKQAGNGGGLPPEIAGQVQADIIKAQAKAENARESHAQRTQQRQVQFQQKIQQDSERHALEMQKQIAQTQVDVAAKDIETAAEIRRSANKPEPTANET